MKFSSNAVLWVTTLLFSDVDSFVLPKPTQNCSTFAESLAKSFASQKVTIMNSTLIPANSTSSNEHEYCQLVGKVAYTNNDTLNFQVYLPDATAYAGRFMAVGKFKSCPFEQKLSPDFYSGNGGMAGTIDTTNMVSQLNKGFAVAGYD